MIFHPCPSAKPLTDGEVGPQGVPAAHHLRWEDRCHACLRPLALRQRVPLLVPKDPRSMHLWSRLHPCLKRQVLTHRMMGVRGGALPRIVRSHTLNPRFRRGGLSEPAKPSKAEPPPMRGDSVPDVTGGDNPRRGGSARSRTPTGGYQPDARGSGYKGAQAAPFPFPSPLSQWEGTCNSPWLA